MKNYIIYFIIVFGVTACGSRKVYTDIRKQSSEVQQKSETKSTDKETEQSKSTKSDEKKNDITEKETIKQTVTEYNNEGKPTKTTTTETIRDKTDKSSRNKNETVTINKTRLRELVERKQIKEKMTIKEKSKSTEVSNEQWAWMGFGIFAVLIVCYFVFRYFKK